MSEPIRYRPDWTYTGTAFVPFCRQQDNGEFVRYEDYAELKAEVENLKKPAVIGGYNISEYIRMANSETLEFDNGDMFADMTLPERIKYIVESHARLRSAAQDNKTECEATRIENARLKAEVEELTGLLKASTYYNTSDEVTRLKAEVERLKSLCDKLGMGGKHTITAITEENALLKAEVDRLADENARLTMMKDACKRMIKRRDKWIWEKRAELERLRASSFVTAVPVEQYERLRKAGDAMADELIQEYGREVCLKFGWFKGWNAAKEGKGQP